MKEESNNKNQELERDSVPTATRQRGRGRPSSSVLARCYNSICSLSTLDSHIDWAIKCHREGALNLDWIEKSAREREREKGRVESCQESLPPAPGTSEYLSTSFSHQLDKLWSSLGCNQRSKLITNHLSIYYTIWHAINNWAILAEFYLYLHFIYVYIRA